MPIEYLEFIIRDHNNKIIMSSLKYTVDHETKKKKRWAITNTLIGENQNGDGEGWTW